MKLSATFNFFDGGELLVPALQSIRSKADHVSVVFQDVSNYGNRLSAASANALRQAQMKGLVDDFIPFTPDLGLTGGVNEFHKRQIGLGVARSAGASHIIFCDVDEFYDPEELEYAKRMIVRNSLDFTTVNFVNYFRRPTLRLMTLDSVPVHEFQTAFICRLTDGTMHDYGGWYPVDQVDATRRIYVRDGKHYKFAAREITMHHMTGVRRDINEKLANSSCNDNPDTIRGMRDRFNLLHQLRPGTQNLLNGMIAHFEEVPDHFHLSHLYGD